MRGQAFNVIITSAFAIAVNCNSIDNIYYNYHKYHNYYNYYNYNNKGNYNYRNYYKN